MLLTKIEDLILPLEKSWKKNNYKDVCAKHNIKKNISTKKIFTNFDRDIDNMFLYAIRSYNNLNTILILGKNKIDSYEIYKNKYYKNYILFGIKEMNIDIELLLKIFYQIYYFKYNNYEIFKENFMKYKVLKNITKIDISIIIVCNRDKINKNNILEENNEKYMLFIPKDLNEKIITVSTLFSQTSLDFLKLQNINNLTSSKMINSMNMFLTYRKWLYDNITLEEHDKFMIFSSTVLFILGIRNAKDLDLYIDNINEENKNKVIDLIENSQYDFELDISLKNSKYWPEHWKVWLDKWARSIGLLYFEEIVCNPKYHMYYLGVKLISLECDIARRIIRNRPRAIADLIALNKLCNLKINIPIVPKYETNYIKLSNISEDEKNKLIAEGGIINNNLNEIKIEKPIILRKFIGTIKYIYKQRYDKNLSINEIKYLIGIDKKKLKKI